MKLFAQSPATWAGFVVLCALATVTLLPGELGGQKKNFKDRFSAEILTLRSGLVRINVAVQDYTSQEEFVDLAETFKKGGASALHHRLRKTKKGYFLVEYGARTDVRVADIRPTEKGWRILVIAERAAHIDEVQRADILRNYPYVCVDVEIDDTGRGKGVLMYYAKIYFTENSIFAVENWSTRNAELTNVRLE